MVALVTLEQARRHLRILHTDEDADLLEKIQQASDIVVDYLQRPELVWTDASNGSPPAASDAPMRVQAAVLLVLAGLWEHRGDGEQDYGQADGYLTKPVTTLLHRLARMAYA